MNTVLHADPVFSDAAAAPYTMPAHACPPVLVESPDDVERELRKIVEISDANLHSGRGCTVLGLDTEWAADGEGAKVALLQLATHGSRCVLVRADCISKENSAC